MARTEFLKTVLSAAIMSVPVTPDFFNGNSVSVPTSVFVNGSSRREQRSWDDRARLRAVGASFQVPRERSRSRNGNAGKILTGGRR